MLKKLIFTALIIVLTGCSGVRTSERDYSAHAENFNLFFMQIPGGDTQKRARELIPEGGEITTMTSSPTDLTSFTGFINRFIGVDVTVISGTIRKEE
jgi:uncharacterized lipoprotein